MNMAKKPADTLQQRAFACLMQADVSKKVEMVNALSQDWAQQKVAIDRSSCPEPVPVPGRPENPELVHPTKVSKRNFKSEIGRIRLVHAIAHIEFNAINLALDAVYRFPDMPEDFYQDWLQVATEEAKHFCLLQTYLTERGSSYGAYTAHNGLWEMAVKTAHDVMIRMALVPRVLEARGLDVTPTMIRQLDQVGDTELVRILEIIFQEEIGHVKIGSHWFYHCCELRGKDAATTFAELMDEYLRSPVTGPFEIDARKAAGFTEQEIAMLCANT